MPRTPLRSLRGVLFHCRHKLSASDGKIINQVNAACSLLRRAPLPQLMQRISDVVTHLVGDGAADEEGEQPHHRGDETGLADQQVVGERLLRASNGSGLHTDRSSRVAAGCGSRWFAEVSNHIAVLMRFASVDPPKQLLTAVLRALLYLWCTTSCLYNPIADGLFCAHPDMDRQLHFLAYAPCCGGGSATDLA